jgi:hypothetical protein
VGSIKPRRHVKLLHNAGNNTNSDSVGSQKTSTFSSKFRNTLHFGVRYERLQLLKYVRFIHIVYVFRINVITDTKYRPAAHENICSLLFVGRETCVDLNRVFQKGKNSFFLKFMNYYKI